MPAFTLEEIKKYTDCTVLQQNATQFSDVSTDTRSIKSGMLFIALKGENFDGHDFCAKAAEKGAAGLIISDEKSVKNLQNKNLTILLVDDTLKAYLAVASCWRDKFSLPIMAITGSNGKTTTKDMTAAILSEKYNVLKTQKNFNSEVGMALTLLNLRPEHEIAVIEMGMRGLGQIKNLAAVAKPCAGIVTNVGDAHLELLGSRENIARAKAELVEAIPANGSVILNADNEYTAAMNKKTSAKVMTFGINNAADIKASDIKTVAADKTTFTCHTPQGNCEMTVPAIGVHNVYDALAAIAAGCVMQLDLKTIANGLAKFTASGMRFEISHFNGCTIINDAYNASPLSTKAAIENLLLIPAQKRILAFGDMKELGSIEKETHENIGRLCAEKKIDILVTLGDLAAHAAKAAKDCGMKKVHSCNSHEEAATFLKPFVTEKNAVLFKGSHSMHMEKIIDLLENK